MSTAWKLFTLLLVFGCHLCADPWSANGQLNDTTLASVREVPLYRTGDTSIAYEAMRKVESKLDLDRLLYGYDSLQIRILLTFSLTRIRQLIVIKYKNGSWTAEHGTLEIKSSKDTGFRLETTRYRSVVPHSGWTNFTTRLFNLGVIELPDFRTIPKGYYHTDETLVFIETATEDTYKIVMYPLRPDEPDAPKEALQVEELIQLLEKELGFVRYERS